MSTPTVQCPQCFSPVPYSGGGGALVCPSCEGEFTPAAADPPARKNPNVPLARAIPVGGAGTPAKDMPTDDAGKAGDQLPRAKRPADRDDRKDSGRSRRDDDRPRSRGGAGGGATRNKRRRYEDDDEPKKKGGSALPVILIVGGVLAVMTVGGAVAVAAAVWLGGSSTSTTAVAYTPPLPAPEEPPRGNWNDPDPFLDQKPEGRKPGDFPPIGPGPQPGGPGGFDPFPVKPDKPKVPKVAPKYAEVVPAEIKPAKLTEDTTELKLPGKVGDTCGGGGGRYFIAHLTDKRQLAILDVNEGKVVKYLSLAADNAKFAAGMNKLVVAYPDQHTLVRYNLSTFEKEDTQKCPADGTIKKVAMGSASAGPLLVALGTNPNQPGGFGGGQSKLEFLDPATMKAVDITQENAQNWRNWADNDHFRASPDGRVFTVHGPNGLLSFPVRGGTAKHHQPNEAHGHLTPGPDGNLYSGNGLFSPDLKRIGRQPLNGIAQSLVPAAEGHLYMQLSMVNQNQFGGIPGEGQKWKAEVKMIGDERTVYTFKDVGSFGNDQWAANHMPVDARLHFAPTAQVLVCVPGTNDRLVLRKFDLDAAFEESGVDYLYVSSRPRTVVPGKGFDYQIIAKSKKGGVKYSLDAGPTGLKVDAAGKVTWATPADFANPESVIVTVSDASGQEIFHSFELAPGDGKGFAGPISGTVKAAPKANDKPDPKAGQGLVVAPDRVFELKPPLVQEKTSVSLPGAADGACVGGGGRFLIFRLGSKKQLAVLDVTIGRVVKYLPLAEGDALFAAGMTKLFVFYKSAGVFMRYDLEKFDKDLTAQNPLGGTPSLLLLGHSSEGPLYVGGNDVGTDTKGYGFVNTRTMKEVKVTLDGDQRNGQVVTGPAFGDRHNGGQGVTVSPDGRTYCWADWNGTRLLSLGEKAGKVKGGNQFGGGNATGLLTPGPDGTLFGPQGMYTTDMKKIGDAKQVNVVGTFAPATSGGWYVSVIDGDRWDPARAKRKIHVGLAGDDRIKFPLDSLDGLPAANQDPWAQPQAGKLPMASRIHLVPEAEILAVLDDGMEKVYLHRLAVKTLLEKADADYLLVTSRPPPAVRGQKWVYAPQVLSKKGGVKVKVESGPDGMTATGGTVSWDVPAKPADDEPTVILTVSDGGGQETFHTFSLGVRAAGLPAVTVLKPSAPAVDPVKPADPAKGGAKAPATFPLKPTAAKDGTDIDLPAAADFACLAGGGRFLLFRLPSKKEVSVFDTVEGKLVKQLPFAEDGALIAGGRGFAFVVNPKAGLVQRWNLSTLEKEATTKLPDGFAPTAAVMGHASDGPLCLGNSTQFGGAASANGFYDPLTLKKIEHSKPANSSPVGDVKPNPSPFTANAVFCSPDGKVWGWWNQGSSPSGLQSLVLDGGHARGGRSHVSVGPVLVGPGGLLFTSGGVFAGDQSKVYDAHSDKVAVQKVNSWTEIGLTGGGFFQGTARTPVPAADGPFYLWFPEGKKATPGQPADKPADHPPPVLKMVGVKEPLADMKGLRGVDEPKADPLGRPPRPRPGQAEAEKASLLFYQRAFLLPAAELIAVLSADGTKIHIHAFKARELMDKSGQDFLVLMGRPPQFATPGQKWTYTPDVWSKKGGVKVEVVRGPVGMKVTGTTVEWDVPKDLLDNRVTAELKITDASGKSVECKIPLSLDGTAPHAPTVTGGGGSASAAPPKPPAAIDPKAKKEMEAIAGTWAIKSIALGNGPEQPLPFELQKIRMGFEKDGTLRNTSGPTEFEGTFKLDPTASPKAIDLTHNIADGKEAQLGIYELDGDTLRLHFAAPPGNTRPKDMKGTNKQTSVMVLMRVKE